MLAVHYKFATLGDYRHGIHDYVSTCCAWYGDSCIHHTNTNAIQDKQGYRKQTP